MTINKALLPLSSGQPPSSTTCLNPGQDRFVLFQPLFDFDHFSPDDIYSLRDVRIKPPEPCLTCLGDKPCFATYRFASVFPVSRLVTTTFPHMKNDKQGKNSLRLSPVRRRGEYQEVFKQVSAGDENWVGLAAPRVDEITLPSPAREIILKLEMADESCQWWSSPENRMTVELYSQARPQAVPQTPTLGLVNVSPRSVAHASGCFPRALPGLGRICAPGLSSRAYGGDCSRPGGLVRYPNPRYDPPGRPGLREMPGRPGPKPSRA